MHLRGIFSDATAPTMDKLIHLNQSTFIHGCFIHDGVFVLDEVIYDFKVKHMKGVFLEL